MLLAGVAPIARFCREEACGFSSFRYQSKIRALGWPDDVLEQWLYDHADNAAFLQDYGEIELSTISWNVETIATNVIIEMSTGPSVGDYINEISKDPEHWINVRQGGVHLGVRLCWDVHGTWKRWPILLDRSILTTSKSGLQIVEGGRGWGF